MSPVTHCFLLLCWCCEACLLCCILFAQRWYSLYYRVQYLVSPPRSPVCIFGIHCNSGSNQFLVPSKIQYGFYQWTCHLSLKYVTYIRNLLLFWVELTHGTICESQLLNCYCQVITIYVNYQLQKWQCHVIYPFCLKLPQSQFPDFVSPNLPCALISTYFFISHRKSSKSIQNHLQVFG